MTAQVSWVRDALRAEGIDITGLLLGDANPTALLLRDRAVDARTTTVEYFRSGSAGAALGPDDLAIAMVRSASIIFISGITAMLSPSSLAYVNALFDVCEAAAIHVCFDPNVRWRLADATRWKHVMPPLMARADTLFVGEDELVTLGLNPDAATLLSERTSVVVVKRGASGVEVVTPHERFVERARPVDVIDTVGAGDAFAGGWISAVLRGKNPRDAAHAASVVASLVVATPGDTSGLPTLPELEALIQTGANVVR